MGRLASWVDGDSAASREQVQHAPPRRIASSAQKQKLSKHREEKEDGRCSKPKVQEVELRLTEANEAGAESPRSQTNHRERQAAVRAHHSDEGPPLLARWRPVKLDPEGEVEEEAEKAAERSCESCGHGRAPLARLPSRSMREHQPRGVEREEQQPCGQHECNGRTRSPSTFLD